MGLGSGAATYVSKSDLAQEQGQEPQLNFRILGRIFRYTGAYRLKRNVVFAITALRAAQKPLLGLFLGMVINGPIAAGDWPGTALGALGFLGFAAFTEITFHFRQRLALELGESVVHDLRRDLYDKLMEMNMSFFTQMKVGSLLSRFISDIENVRRGVQTVFFFSLLMLGQMLGAGVLMLVTNPVLFCIVLVVAPVVYGINHYFRSRLSHWSRETQRSQSRLTGKIAETVNGIKIIQSFARQRRNADEFEELAGQHASNNQRLVFNSAVYLPLLEFNSQCFLAILLLTGTYGAYTGAFDAQVGDLVTFFFLANLFFAPIQSIGRIYTQALASMAGAERVFSLLDEKPDWEDRAVRAVPQPLRGRIEAQGLGFAYSKDEPVLQDVSFVVEPGQTAAVVGHTGSGKSTLSNLVAKFYIPTEGELFIDDIPIQDLHGPELRRQYGIVTQTPFLFDGTALENILLGNARARREDAVRAVERLGCLDLLQNLPSGLETQVGEGGNNVSSGQRQIICFARAMVADPRILILDEATSSIDTMTEARLQEALGRLLQNRASIVIAHRLSAVRHADKILVLKEGRLVETGTHQELLKRAGHYAALYREFTTGYDERLGS